ncbi:MAG: AAA family ATPase, partial [Nitriliruptoraceae bacterium]
MALPREVLEIRLFGGFSVQFDGRPLPPLPSRSARLLFAWLALHAGRPQPRSLLSDRFWPEATESRARRRLSHALWQIQDCLGELAPDHTYLVTQGDDVVFDASAPYWLDAEEFEARLDRIDRAGAVDDAGLRNLRHCVDLYHGDLLAGSYESWVVDEQDRLRHRYATALGRLVDACKKRGNFDEALTFAQRLTHQVPLREDVHREVMRLCVLLGQHSQALEQYERCRSVLLEELGTPPSAETEQLRERISETRDVSVARRTPVEQLVSRKLVGRDEPRVALVDQLERALAGSAGMVFVEGEPGIGKSQLLAQVADDARWRGFTVVWGECAGPQVPYAAIREALEPELDAVRVAQLRAHVEPVWLREAARLLDPLRAAVADTPAPTLAGTDGAERMREALVQVLAGFAAIDPLLVVIEDAQRADQETLELLRALGRHAATRPLLVVLSFRDADARHDDLVWSGLRAVDRDSRPTRIKLEPLTAFETAALLREVLGAADVPARFAEAVHRESGGNPLYTLELLRALRDAGRLRDEDRDRLDTLEVPVTDGLKAIIDDRLDYLDASATDVVQLAAVCGAECDIDVLRAGSELDERALAGALAELVRRNLLELGGEVCRFTHAATRRVVLGR